MLSIGNLTFPGSNAGASLKRRCWRFGQKRNLDTFPGSNAGASLKRIEQVGTAQVGTDFPRQQCRGLIEATEKPHLPLKQNGTFPGSNAGASLKP